MVTGGGPLLFDQLRASIMADHADPQRRGYTQHTRSLENLLMAEWAKRRGVVPATGNEGWQRLLGKQAPMLDWGLPHDDHTSMWRKPGSRSPKIDIWVSQPYPLSSAAALEMTAAAKAYGLEFSISAWPAWHYPGAVLFVEWRAACPPMSAVTPVAP